MLPVKTDRPVDKDKIFDVMNLINSLIVSAPVKVGDVVACDVCGANIISAKEVL
jgi:CxxC motif-containing protein